jgi:valyl-tRNA synthetase
MDSALDKKYQPKETEEKIYQAWESSGFFSPENLRKDNKNKAFTAIMAPPNITGSLHMGHALENALVDVIVRKKRMEGFRVLWVPGTDHAGIATQNVVEKKLAKENIKRKDLGRSLFVDEVWKWKEQYGDIILNQFKKLGISVDWTRSRFTLDKNYEEAVKTAFDHYQKLGWIYQGQRLVNWCPRCSTALSDLEVEHNEEEGNLWHIKYPLKDSNDYIVVATTRPETMLGDTAVAVNPNDNRYKKLVGKTIVLPIVKREIPLIADKVIDKDFATGAVKVTPAHSLVDFEIADRHNLPSVKIINEFGRMTDEAGKDFKDLKTIEAREKVLEHLKKENLLEKVEKYTHSASHCYRCNAYIEPLTSSQWFLKMDKLAPLAIKAVKDGKIKFHPKRWEKPYFDWLENVRDWCISRQIWWGHELPIFYCAKKLEKCKIESEKCKINEDFIIGTQKPKECPFCKECEMVQDEDVLDTWFSSALWPFAILGWPQKYKDINNDKKCPDPQSDLGEFYPTDLVTSAPEILYLWITRMIFSGMEFMGKEPFKNVYIHPVVLTKDGRRMSKSLGTGIDPLDLIEKYGADATRFGLLWLTGTNQSIRFDEDSVIMGQKFCNKIWNATRFILLNNPPLIDADFEKKLAQADLCENDKAIVNQLINTIKSVNLYIEKFRFDKATETLYNFFWHDFCDTYIEKSKESVFNPPSEEVKIKTQTVLLYVLLNSIKLLHPFIPFVTEQIYQILPIKNKEKFIMIEKWPTV